MGARIVVETTFEDGKTQKRNIGRLCSAPDNLESESLGLRLDEAKSFFGAIAGSHPAKPNRRSVGGKPNLRRRREALWDHNDRGRTLDTLYGRFRVKAPRLRQCTCKSDSVAAEVVLSSPLNAMFPDRATPELLRLQVELGSRHTFREAARLLGVFLPCAPQSNTTARKRLGRIAEKLDVADAEHRDKKRECHIVSTNSVPGWCAYSMST